MIFIVICAVVGFAIFSSKGSGANSTRATAPGLAARPPLAQTATDPLHEAVGTARVKVAEASDAALAERIQAHIRHVLPRMAGAPEVSTDPMLNLLQQARNEVATASDVALADQIRGLIREHLAGKPPTV